MNDINIGIGAIDRTGEAIKSAQKSINGFASSTRSALGTIGIGIGVGALAAGVRSAIEYGSAITDAAIATNTGIEALQVLRYAAQDAGADSRQLDMALVRVQKAAVDASNGLSTYTRAFAALGINVDDFLALPAERKLETIGSAMASADDQQRAYAAAMDILGTRNAPRLMEVLQRLASEGYDKTAESARRLGQIMTEETARSMDSMADMIARQQTRMTAGFATFAAHLGAGTETVWGTLKRVYGEGTWWTEAFAQANEEVAQQLIGTEAATDQTARAQRELNLELERATEAEKKLAEAQQTRVNSALERLANEARAFEMERSDTQGKLSIVEDDLAEQRKELEALNKEFENGLDVREKIVEKEREILASRRKLYRLQQTASKESAEEKELKEREAKDALDNYNRIEREAAERKKDAVESALTALGVSSSMTSSGPLNQPASSSFAPAKLSPIEKMELDAQRTKDRLDFQSRSSSDPSSPLFNQMGQQTQRADIFAQATEQGVQSLDRMASSMQRLVDKIKTLEEQIANAR